MVIVILVKKIFFSLYNNFYDRWNIFCFLSVELSVEFNPSISFYFIKIKIYITFFLLNSIFFEKKFFYSFQKKNENFV